MNLRALLSGGARWHIETGDCRALFRLLPSGAVDHVITDPPYEVEAHTRQRHVRRGGKLFYRALDFHRMDERTRRVVARQVARVVRRWGLFFCQVEALTAWREACNRVGFPYRRGLAWVKPDSAPQFTGDRPAAAFETIACAHAFGACEWNAHGKRGVYTAACVRRPLHPTQKPLRLMLELVRDFTRPGELVLDPFCGSGTTGVACLRLGRRFLGFELSPKHARIARARLAADERGLTVEAAEAGQITIFDLLGEGRRGRQEADRSCLLQV